MTEGSITQYVAIVRLLASGLMLGLFLVVLKGKRSKEVVIRSIEVLFMKVKETRFSVWDYEKWEQYLVLRGAAFHFGTWINPVTYLCLCILLAVIGFLIGISQSMLFALVGLCLGMVLPGFLVEHFNKRDNEEMLTDLNLVYSALAIQIRAGVYVTDALAECYASVRHRRLKQGLLKLSGDIVMKADLQRALTDFQEQFCNQYIDALCITIMQAMESGQAVELLGDIADQIKDLEIIVQNRKKQKLDRSITFYELGIFAAIISLVIYACVSNLLSAEMFVY